MSFNAVVAGNATLATDINQYANSFNGSVGAQAKVLSASNALQPYIGLLPSAPASDQGVYDAQVSVDAFARVSLYIRASDGYGGIRAGAGVGAATAHWYAQANGWKTDESVTIVGALNVSGTTTLAGISAASLSLSGGISASGAITGSNYNGISIDIEGGITVIRSQPTGDPIIIQVNGANTTYNTDGSITVSGPLRLTAGFQEVGWTGADFYVSGSGVGLGIADTFRQVMTNTPSSLTLSGIGVVGVSSLGVPNISNIGYFIHWLSTGTGNSEWFGQYTTVGNCLLGVNEVARTFSHHCDMCQAVHRDVPVEDLTYRVKEGKQRLWRNEREMHRYNGAVCLSYTCPDCEASEHFDTRMTEADEADATPQGRGVYVTTRGTQARMIRQLLRLLNLHTAEDLEVTIVAA